VIKIKNQLRKLVSPQGFAFLLILALVFFYGFYQSLNPSILSFNGGVNAAISESHQPINIENDIALANFKVSGTGEAADPFVLTGWEISTENSHGIRISGTTKHFIISNCKFTGQIGGYSGYHGIYLENVPAGTARIENVTTNNCDFGIYVDNSDNVMIINHIGKDNLNYGIFVDQSVNTSIFNCTYIKNSIGVYIYSASHCTVMNSSFVNNYNGLQMGYHSDDSIIINNTFQGNGIVFEFSSEDEALSNTIENNTVNGLPFEYIENATYKTIVNPHGQLVLINCTNVTVKNQNCSFVSTGISVLYSENCTLINNTVINNRDRGISILQADNSTIMNNTCMWNEDYGIYAELSDFSIIKNNTINDNFIGILVSSTSSATIFRNQINDNDNYGLRISYSSSTTVVNNTIMNNGFLGLNIWSSSSSIISNNTFQNDGVHIGEDTVEAYLSYVLEQNTVNGLPLGYFENLTETEITNPYGQLLLINCSKVIIKNQNCSSGGGIMLRYCPESQVINNTCSHNEQYGIDLDHSDSALIANNTCRENARAIRLLRSGNTTIFNNTALFSEEPGISLFESGHATISNNTISNNNGGIYLSNSGFTMVIHNRIMYNGESGMEIDFSNYCTIIWNLFMKNYYYGVKLINSYHPSNPATDNNSIHHNTFKDNDEAFGHTYPQASDNGDYNLWYDPETLEGNYWSDYSGSGGYNLDGSTGSIDLYPLNLPPVPIPNTSPYFTNVPNDVTFTRGTGQVTWYATDPDNNPASYIVYSNGDVYQEDEWASEVAITVELGAFVEGVYNLTIVVWDTYSLSASDTVLITINPPPPEAPQVSHPSDITYVEGTTGHEIAWDLMDPDNNPTTYVIYRNGAQIGGDSWISGNTIKINVDGLTEGSYNYTIIAFDEDSLFAQDSVKVTVVAQAVETTETEPSKPMTSDKEPSPSITSGYMIVISFVALGIFLAARRKKN
jgi:parallel beta-helix repeat protein